MTIEYDKPLSDRSWLGLFKNGSADESENKARPTSSSMRDFAHAPQTAEHLR